MKIPVSWLKDFVDLENITVNRLCEALVSVGFEVEEVIELGREISNVVVGEIISMEKHPDADKLKVCRVDVGKEVLQIVTAATNVKTGDKIPLALNGATLAGGTVIKNGKLRGVASNGMMCGGEELGICEDQYAGASVDGVLILEQNAEVGRDIKEIVGLDECVIDVAVTFNRPDCNSVVGIAREAAVALGRKFTPPETDFDTVEEISTRQYVNVDVRDAELCPAYFMQAAEVQIEPSPLWMRRRLHAAGLRGINNIVDVTNYVLLEVGQPMHAFDYKEISDKTIVVRRARKGETIIPLNEKEYGLDENILVIADKSRPVGLAGVMGGLNSGIKPDTSTVLLEAAEFNRENIRRTSRRLGIRSDSSARFEKGVDSCTAHLGLMRALHLISKLKCGRIAADTIESLSHEIKEREIKFHYSRVKNLLGIDIPQSESKKILENLGIKTVFEGQTLKCFAPAYRRDLESDCDIIEEIIRVYGYDKIVSSYLENTVPTYGGKTSAQELCDRVKNIAVGLGYNQITTYSFGGKQFFDKAVSDGNSDSEKCIKIVNPLGEELSLMRRSLIAHMCEALSVNLSRKNENLSLFEIAKVYLAENLPLTELPEERETLCMATDVGDFFKLKSDVMTLLDNFNVDAVFTRSVVKCLHPGISADITDENGNCLGFLGELHPTVCANFEINKRVYVAQIDLEKLKESKKQKSKYVPIPRYPSVDRDIAVVVNVDVAAADVIDTIKQSCKLCESVELFDVYRGEQIGKDEKSMALSLKFRNKDKTLNDEEVEPQIKRALRALGERFNARLR